MFDRRYLYPVQPLFNHLFHCDQYTVCGANNVALLELISNNANEGPDHSLLSIDDSIDFADLFDDTGMGDKISADRWIHRRRHYAPVAITPLELGGRSRIYVFYHRAQTRE